MDDPIALERGRLGRCSVGCSLGRLGLRTVETLDNDEITLRMVSRYCGQIVLFWVTYFVRRKFAASTGAPSPSMTGPAKVAAYR